MASFIEVKNGDLLYTNLRHKRYKLESQIIEFVNTGYKCAEWHIRIPEDYKSISAAYGAMWRAVKRYGEMYHVAVFRTDYKVYLKRTDI